MSISRRRFLSGSASAAVGGLAAGAFDPAVLRAQAPGARAGTLERLRRPSAADEAYWRLVRREFNIADGLTYMNNGTLGPMPRTVLEANVRYLRDIAEDPHALPSTEPVRGKVAAFVGATADEIVLTRSTTEGMKIFAAGLDLKAGDEVLMSTHEHPGGYGPWRAREKRHGIKVVEVAVPAPPESADQIVSLFEKAITPRTRVLMVSHIVFLTGLVMPLKPLADLARRRGLLFSVDAAHAVGMLDLTIRDFTVDHYTAAGQKWLMAGTGTGVAYFRREIQDRVWSDMWSPTEDPKMAARKYERAGQRDIPSALGIGDAIDFQEVIGKQTVEARVRQLAARVKEGLTDIPGVTLYTSMAPELSGGLTTFSIREIPRQNVQKFLLEERGIYITTPGLNPVSCRVSTHIYTQPSEVDQLLDAVRHLAANSSRYLTTAGPAQDD